MAVGGDHGGREGPTLATAVRHSMRGPLYPKLRPGPGRSTDQVLANQRARLIGAMVELVAERGYGGVTVRGLSRLAGVSTKTFYECFANVEECFAATYARIVRNTLKGAPESSSPSGQRVRTRIRVSFEALEDDPKAARLILVEALSAGPLVRSKVRASRRALEQIIGDELAASSEPSAIQPRVASGATAAALHLARSRVIFGNSESAAVLADGFADWLLDLRGGASLTSAPAAAFSRPTLEAESDLGDDRSFLLAAVVRLSERDGYERLTVPAICREAGVSRRRFDRCFAGVVDCYLAAIESRIADSLVRATRQAGAYDTWGQAVVRAVATLCADFARQPGLARFTLVDVLAPGERGLRLRERMVVRLARLLRNAAPADVRPGQLAAEASIAAAMGIAGSDAAADRAERTSRAVPEMAFVILAPAVGGATAERTILTELRVIAREQEVRKHSTNFS